MLRVALAIAAIPFLLSACGGGGGDQLGGPPPAPLDGAWSGTWTATANAPPGVGGEAELMFVPDPTGSSLDATLNLHLAGANPCDYVGTFGTGGLDSWFSVTTSNGTFSISITLRVWTANHIDGTYLTVSPFSCFGTGGTLSFQRDVPVPAQSPETPEPQEIHHIFLYDSEGNRIGAALGRWPR